MKASVSKSEIGGRVEAPPSKSYTIRGLVCAALADGESEIVCPLPSDDTEAALRVLSQVGVGICQEGNTWRVSGGRFRRPDADLFCGDSAATLRFMTAICSLVPGRCRLVAGPSLGRRPVGPLVAALKQWGVVCSAEGEVAPVVVDGGSLNGGLTEMAGNISSQFVSALLFIAPLAAEGAEIRLSTPLESRAYVAMTLQCLKEFAVAVEKSSDFSEFVAFKQAYRPARYVVEGDWSSASYFLALGATCGEVEVTNLNIESLQSDKILLDLLRDMGAQVVVKENSVVVNKSRLRAIRADLSECIDLLPTLAVLAAAADGKSEFSGVARARLKESNRVAAVKDGLKRMGIAVGEGENTLTVTGSRPEGAVIDSRGDHRIAMAFSVLGTVAGDMVIEDAGCVAKTFPRFWDILKSIGGKVEFDGK